MLFRETVLVYFENHTEYINTLCEDKVERVVEDKVGGTYGYHRAFHHNSTHVS
jgi:hypothetical protein